MLPRPLAVFLALLLAGCLAPAGPDAEKALADAFARGGVVIVGDETAPLAQGIEVSGGLLVADDADWEGPAEACGPPRCAAHTFRLDFGIFVPSPVEVQIKWTPRFEKHEGRDQVLGLRLHDPPLPHTLVRGWTSERLLIPATVTGDYVVNVDAKKGFGNYTLSIRAAPAEPEELLPNLVTLLPTDLGIVSPTFGTGSGIVDIESNGCGADEQVEDGARRCLRLSNSIGNVGEGPLEVRLALSEAPDAARGQADVVQRIRHTDGSFRDAVVGRGEWHPIHGHFHFVGIADFRVHSYDVATQARGEPVGEGRKAGFCLLDIGHIEDDVPVGDGRYDSQGCFAPDGAQDWLMGISPGWYDEYHRGLSDQYVDIEGVPDGTYELVSRSNFLGGIIETDLTDNEASVVFALIGDSVRVIGPPPR